MSTVSDVHPIRRKVLVESEGVGRGDFGTGVLEIPESALNHRSSARWGRVLACGPQCEEVRVGDRICWGVGVQAERRGVSGQHFIDESDVLMVDAREVQA